MSIVYSPNEERANYLSHALGILLGLAAGIHFLCITYTNYDSLAQLGVWLYLFGVCSSYLASTVYHACPMQSPQRERLRKFDHAAIYWHIAGSYSPVVLAGMRDDMFWGWLLFILVWSCALFGTFTSFRGLKEHSHVETCCFVGMGLLILLAFKPVLDAIGWDAMKWIIAEGIAFITGAVFYSFNKRPFMHTVFHVFVLLGSVCHILALKEVII